MIMWTLFGIASNFLEDFHIPPRVQTANFAAVLIMTLAYAILVLVGNPVPTLYPNKYDFLLMGSHNALYCIIAGLVIGGPLGFLVGNRLPARIALGVLAVICEGLIALGTVMWILAQE
jgi:UDP-N-acetylmuramyl pentapeptide phosphotransferase/UDP-N-acetylglucosamine-1-phosphate transferase